uniref:Uncharacterized protein n=1 Tax=Arundo donax TaxID=35708 RepID=A0A0A8ZIG2_ARUDO
MSIVVHLILSNICSLIKVWELPKSSNISNT